MRVRSRMYASVSCSWGKHDREPRADQPPMWGLQPPDLSARPPLDRVVVEATRSPGGAPALWDFWFFFEGQKGPMHRSTLASPGRLIPDAQLLEELQRCVLPADRVLLIINGRGPVEPQAWSTSSLSSDRLHWRGNPSEILPGRLLKAVIHSCAGAR